MIARPRFASLCCLIWIDLALLQHRLTMPMATLTHLTRQGHGSFCSVDPFCRSKTNQQLLQTGFESCLMRWWLVGTCPYLCPFSTKSLVCHGTGWFDRMILGGFRKATWCQGKGALSFFRLSARQTAESWYEAA